MTRRGVTLVEVLTCIAIIGVVAAIAFPVFASAKLSSKKTASKESLHQAWLALMIYRSDHGGGADFGTAGEMALPMDEASAKILPRPAYVGPNGAWQLYWSPQTDTTDYRVTKEWVDYTRRCREDSVLIGDRAYDTADPRLGMSEPSILHILLGLRLSGKIEERRNRGTPSSPYWWPCVNSNPN